MGASAASVFILSVGVVAASTSVIFIKASTVPPVLLAAYRMLLASLLLLPLFAAALKRHGNPGVKTLLTKSVVPGIVLAIHFITWISGSRLTLAANATLIVDMLPVVMPFVVFVIAGERVTRREILGTLVALCGIMLLVISDLGIGNMVGNALCFVSMLLYAIYLSLAKRNNDFPSIWMYVVPVYLIGGSICLVLGSLIDPPTLNLPIEELLFIAGLAVIPTVIGHTAANYAMGKLRAQLVAIMGLGEFIFATMMAYLFFREVPSVLFIPASMLVVAAAAIVLQRRRRE
jgi:drug/metabolite transporter (DMT)-like permease